MAGSRSRIEPAWRLFRAEQSDSGLVFVWVMWSVQQGKSPSGVNQGLDITDRTCMEMLRKTAFFAVRMEIKHINTNINK